MRGHPSNAPELMCERCGRAYIPKSYKPSRKPQRFCSMACYKPPSRILTCERCARPYPWHASRRGRFCSIACMRNPIRKVCVECGGPFEVKASSAAHFTVCSLACKRQREAARRRSLVCETCGLAFMVTQSAPQTRRYCSWACKPVVEYVTRQCWCGQAFTRERWRGGEFCSVACASIQHFERDGPGGSFGEKVARGYRTDIEADVEQQLVRLRLRYDFERRFGRYVVDFWLIDFGVALECDGWRHKFRTDKDIRRDAYLQERHNMLVIRIPGEAIYDDAARAVRVALRAAGIRQQAHVKRPP